MQRYANVIHNQLTENRNVTAQRQTHSFNAGLYYCKAEVGYLKQKYISVKLLNTELGSINREMPLDGC